MLQNELDQSTYRVQSHSYRTALLLMVLPPLMLYELGPQVLDGSIAKSDLIGLAIAVVLPPIAAFFLFELSSFSFSTDDNLFRWRRRGLFGVSSGSAPLDRVIEVRREALESSSSSGLHYAYRLVVRLDDQTEVPLTRRFSGLNGPRLDKIVAQIREHLGHFTPLR